jgi:signal transduction histidine kinase
MPDGVRESYSRFIEYFGAHRVPQRVAQERDRALQRGVITPAIASVWLLQAVSGQSLHAPVWFVFFLGVVSPVLSFGYRRLLLSRPEGGVWFQYFTLVVDPISICGVLALDPGTFAFLNPFLLVIVVRSGLRYGIRTMYLAWVSGLAGAGLLAMSEFWRTQLELTLSFLLMMAFVPVFFSSLIQRIHNVRAIEEERARVAAMTELAAARSVFLSKVSHELRSPLQSIVSALDVIEIRHSHAFEDDIDLIARMRRSSMLLNTQLRDLMTLAKGEAGHLELRPQAFDAVALVEALADGAYDLASAKGLTLTVELPSGPVFVVADASRIDQVLANLLVNSIRYTDSGAVKIVLHEYQAGEGRLRFTIADTGPGIPESVLPNLFAPDKLASSVARRGEGSGIGLAVVRVLVDHLGATMTVRSASDTGTTFTLDVPAEPIDSGRSDSPAPQWTGRVLIVDDRADVLDGLASVIHELGYECDRAKSAAGAANLLAARRYDIVVFDFDMPTKNGAELAAETRRGQGPNCGSHFLGMSAAEVPPDAVECFDAWLLKPIDQAALRRALAGTTLGYRPSQPGLWNETQ